MFKRDLQIERTWVNLMNDLEALVGKKPKDLNGVLFLIGVQELGKGTRTFSKEEKQDLMHIAICKVLSYAGYYKLEGVDKDGWPHWKLLKRLPHFDLLDQETFLKIQIMDYFQEEYNWIPKSSMP